GVGVLQPRIPARGAGVVDEMRDPPELTVDRREGARHVFLARHVALDGKRAPAGIVDRRHDLARRRRVAQIVHRDIVAAPAGKLRSRSPDAAARAGDQQNLAHWCRSRMPWRLVRAALRTRLRRASTLKTSTAPANAIEA